MFVNFNILNQLGSPAINSNTFANRPAAGQTGRLFVSTDTFEIYRDNGTTWDLIGGPGSSTIIGTGTATQVAYFTAAQSIGSSANLFWDNTNTRLGIGTNIPSDTLSVTGTAYITGDITGNRLIKIGGLSTQYLMADGSTSTLTNPVTGTGAATQVAFWNSSSNITGSNNLFWNNTSGRLGINTATPGVSLDVHGTGTLQQLNTTGATANNYLAFQRTGTTTFSIGDTYNGGSNYFRIFGNSLSADILQIFAATGKSTLTATETYSTGVARGNYLQYTLIVPNGTSFSSPNAITAFGATLDFRLDGNATIPGGARTGLDARNSVSFTGAGTLTMTQPGTNTRAFSNLTTGWSFAGTAVGTITELAGLRVLFPENSGSAVNITNNYAILINNQTANSGTITYTNRWGIYQEGSSDLNYFNGNLLIKTTTNSGEALQVNGSAKATNVVIEEQAAPATPATGTGIIYAKTDNNAYYKNDAGVEFNLTQQNVASNQAFTALGSAIIGYSPMNLSNLANATKALFDGTLYVVGYYLPVGATITGVKWYQGAQGNYTADNYNGVALFSYSGGTITLVASSTNDGNIWKGTANTWQTKAFSSTYVAAAGMYFIGMLYNYSAQTTAPTIGHATSINGSSYDFTNSAKMTCDINGQNSISASYAMSSFAANTFPFTLFLY